MLKSKKAKICLLSGTTALLVAVVVSLLLCGSKWGIPPFGFLRDERLKKLEGNSEEYAIENVVPFSSSPLEGMNICYLGSSVTYGASSLQTSFVEYIAKRNNTTFVKEAVSGTTLTQGDGSYVERLQKIDRSQRFDLFVCQLSTNDASKNRQIGNIDSDNLDTVCGAINYVIRYVEQAWNCPIVFYTNAYYQSDQYKAMTASLQKIAEKKNIGEIDLYNDAAFNDITDEQRKLYMEDSIHPTKAGYLRWWTPKMEEYLYSIFR